MQTKDEKESPKNFQDQQAQFQQALLTIAYKKASEAKTEELGFDLRGRVIYDLCLDSEVFKEIFTGINGHSWRQDEFKFSEERGKLKALIGIEVSETIRCNLDLFPDTLKSPEVEDSIKHLKSNRRHFIPPRWSIIYPQRMSIIPLYEELLANIEHHHAAVKKQLTSKLSSEELTTVETALSKTFSKVREKLQTEVDTIGKSLNSKQSVKEINQKLDLARSKIHKDLKKFWFTQFKSQIDQLDRATTCTIYSALSDDSFKVIYKTTPAHQYDIFGTDFANNMVTYITNSGERTSHNKDQWSILGGPALRFIMRNALVKRGDDWSVMPCEEISARVPSLSAVKKNENKDDITRDIGKIGEFFRGIHAKFDAFALEAEQKDDSDSSKAIVYNLLTSLDPFVTRKLDIKNFQNEAARRILMASHQYNKGVTASRKYIWVQNLGVNRHSNSLNDFFPSELEKEVRLMVDIALLYTLYQRFSEEDVIRDAYRAVLAQYKLFLSKNTNPANFHKSDQGKKAAKTIKQFKKIKVKNFFANPENFVSKVECTLLYIYANNLHYKEKYGNLVQALSIFLERKSISGCKSANERHEDVQKRVAILINQAITITRAFDNFFKDPKSKNLDVIDKALASAVNYSRMYGDEAIISSSDQAGPSKLQQRANFFVRQLWNLGAGLMGLATVASIGLGMTILTMAALGLMAFPPLQIALAISVTVLALGIVTSPIDKFWNFSKLCLSLGGISAIGISLGLGVMAVLGLAFPPLSLALSIAVGALALAMIISTTAAFGFKAKNTNYACSSKMVNCNNAHASEMQSGRGAKMVMDIARQELKLLQSTTPKTLGAKSGCCCIKFFSPAASCSGSESPGNGCVSPPKL